jgi:acylphosphatase
VIVSRAGKGGRPVPAYRYVVQGRVQGVGYRYFVLRQAEALGVCGFARNLPDGAVEVVAEGSAEVLAAFEALLRDGPAFAEVTGVEREESPGRGSSGFHIR